VVSVPELVNRTRSALGMISVSFRATSACHGVSCAHTIPMSSACWTARLMAGWPWPSSEAPDPVWKSR
jgi:hypothetical protein